MQHSHRRPVVVMSQILLHWSLRHSLAAVRQALMLSFAMVVAGCRAFTGTASLPNCCIFMSCMLDHPELSCTAVAVSARLWKRSYASH